MKIKSVKFEYPEDKNFFTNLFVCDNEKQFDKRFKDYFDFRDPKVKRVEFNKIRDKIFQRLVERHGKRCQLQIHPDCSKIKKFNIDHFIPLSTNELNKKFRNLKRVSGKKNSAQSFGSNNIKNLVIACGRCNAYKKHRIFKPIFKKFTSNSFLGLPLTGQEKKGSWYVEISQSGKKNWVMLNQARILDKKRLTNRIGTIDDTDFKGVREGFLKFYGS